MRIFYSLFALLMLTFMVPLAQTKQVQVNKKQAQEAYAYLNSFRDNPAQLMRELGIKFDISKVSKVQLRWNAQLAKVAEFRASDMAKRNYFDHVSPEGLGPNQYIHQYGYKLHKDWLQKPSANFFESIGANHDTAIEGIKAFIIGKGSPGYMHRKHVLGMDDWNASLYDIGIGFVQVEKGFPYKTYLCVIIAKHEW